MATTRGSWTLDEGIAARWEAQGLDATFRAEWPAGNTGYAPLNDGEARPETPQPYCIYEKAQPLIVGHHTGAVGGEAQQLQQIEVQFTVHAKSTNNESGKAIAKRMMTAIMTAYDPGTTKLSILPDCHIVVYRGADFHVREGDEEWAWTVLYEFLIDTTYNQ